MRRSILSLLILLLALPLPAAAQQRPYLTSDDTTAVGLDPADTPADIALALSQQFVPFTPAEDRFRPLDVVIGRDDSFADSLAAGGLQSGREPLLLVPSDGPVPDGVNEEIGRLLPDRIVIVGGTAAVSQAVEDELIERFGAIVVRLAGDSRIATAVEVATQVVTADTVDVAVLARAFGPQDNPTASFADSIAAGAWAASQEAPVLLTATDDVPAETLAYLQQQAFREVQVVGGTAAISEAAFQQLIDAGIAAVRVAGESRTATAIEIADRRGTPEAGGAAPAVILADGFSADAWSAFAAASVSSASDGPIVVTPADDLAADTEAFLAASGASSLLCLGVSFTTCEEARTVLGFAAAADYDAALPTETGAFGGFSRFAPTGAGTFYALDTRACLVTAGNLQDRYHALQATDSSTGDTVLVQLVTRDDVRYDVTVFEGDAVVGPDFAVNRGLGQVTGGEGAIRVITGTFDEGAEFEISVDLETVPDCSPIPDVPDEFSGATLAGRELLVTAKSCIRSIPDASVQVFAADDVDRIVWIEVLQGKGGTQVTFTDASSLELIGSAADLEPTGGDSDRTFYEGVLEDGTAFSLSVVLFGDTCAD